MNTTLQRAVPALVVAGLAAVPASKAAATSPWRAPHASASPTPTATATKAKAKTKKYKGPTVDSRYGPVQAVISIKKKKITAVKILVEPDTNRSQFIDDHAVPILRKETLKAQSADIDTVSGATVTSESYMESLQSAIDKAHFKTPKS